MIRSSDNVQIYPPIDGIKFPWSEEEEEREGGSAGKRKGASSAEAPTRKVCDLGRPFRAIGHLLSKLSKSTTTGLCTKAGMFESRNNII